MVYRRNYRHDSRPGDKWVLLFYFVCLFVFIYLCEKTGNYIKISRCEKKCLGKCHKKIEKYLCK
jgi:hypothetical protein